MTQAIRLHWLDPNDPQQPFPPPHLALKDPNGLLAIGGDLSPTRLLNAYAQGIFPWYNADEPILWWCPDPRTVLVPAALHVSHSLAKKIRRADYGVSFDRAFADVLDGCASERAQRQGTWLGRDMRAAYAELHRLGHAHSVEFWQHGLLRGGLYGVAIGRTFFGESMFSRVSDASKIALYHLCQQLQAWGFDLIDCQVGSDHLRSLGAIELPRTAFLEQIAQSRQHAFSAPLWQLPPTSATQTAHLPPVTSHPP